MSLRTYAILAAVVWAGLATAATPHWIWSAKGERGDEKLDLKRVVKFDQKPKSAKVAVSCDNFYELLINGKKVASGTEWNEPQRVDVSKHLQAGDNEIVAKAGNAGGIAGFLFVLEAKVGGKAVEVVLAPFLGAYCVTPGAALPDAFVPDRNLAVFDCEAVESPPPARDWPRLANSKRRAIAGR